MKNIEELSEKVVKLIDELGFEAYSITIYPDQISIQGNYNANVAAKLKDIWRFEIAENGYMYFFLNNFKIIMT